MTHGRQGYAAPRIGAQPASAIGVRPLAIGSEAPKPMLADAESCRDALFYEQEVILGESQLRGCDLRTSSERKFDYVGDVGDARYAHYAWHRETE